MFGIVFFKCLVLIYWLVLEEIRFANSDNIKDLLEITVIDF